MNNNDKTNVSVKEHRHLTTRDDMRVAVIDLIAQARRELVICSPALDPALYNRAVLTEALGHFIAQKGYCRLRIVVEDTEQLLLDNVRLVELTRRYSDIILIRRLGELHHGLAEMIIVADSESCFRQQDVATIDATLDLHVPHLSIPLARRFESIWAASEPVPGLHGFLP
jgi:hypothetical protein